jgi:hypothetical protein
MHTITKRLILGSATTKEHNVLLMILLQIEYYLQI